MKVWMKWLIKMILFITYGLVFAVYARLSLNWLWLYGFMIPGLIYLVYGGILYLFQGPKISVRIGLVNSMHDDRFTVTQDYQTDDTIKDQKGHRHVVSWPYRILDLMFFRRWHEALLAFIFMTLMAYWVYQLQFG